MYLFVVEKVIKGQKVRPQEDSRDQFPEEEYTVVKVEPKIEWDHTVCSQTHDPADPYSIGPWIWGFPHPDCQGCGNMWDGQYLTVRDSSGQEKLADSGHFCSFIQISLEALKLAVGVHILS